MTTNNQNIELLKCEGINKWYGNLHALKDVNMSINKEINQFFKRCFSFQRVLDILF